MDFIRHQIRFSGCKSGIFFSDDALGRIYDYTKSIPRQINRLCTTTLIVGITDGKQILEESSVRKAIVGLHQAGPFAIF